MTITENRVMRTLSIIFLISILISCKTEKSLDLYETNIYHYRGGLLDSIANYSYEAKIIKSDTAFLLYIKHLESQSEEEHLTPYYYLLNNCESVPEFAQGYHCLDDTISYEIEGRKELIYKFNLMYAPADGWTTVYFNPKVGEIVNFGWGWFTIVITESIDDPIKNELLSKLRMNLLKDDINFPGQHP